MQVQLVRFECDADLGQPPVLEVELIPEFTPEVQKAPRLLGAHGAGPIARWRPDFVIYEANVLPVSQVVGFIVLVEVPGQPKGGCLGEDP